MNKRSRFFLLLVVVVLCVVFLLPTIKWYAGTPKELQTLALSSLEKIKDYSSAIASEDLNMLMDLQKQDPNAMLDDEFDYLVKEAKDLYKLQGKDVPKDMSVRNVLSAFSGQLEVKSVIEEQYREEILDAKGDYNAAVKLGLDLSGGMSIIAKADLDAAIESMGDSVTTDNEVAFKEDAMNQVVETLTGRIDQFGLTSPIIRRQGEDRIYIEIPGAAEADTINSIILGKGILNFRLVDTDATDRFLEYYSQNPTKTFTANGELLDPTIIPENTEVMGLYQKDEYGLDERVGYLVIEKDVILDGKYLEAAQVSAGQLGKPEVHLTLDSDGAVIFAEATAANVGRSLAIVSDNKVKSYATINEAIPGGNVSISGFSLEEAQNLQKVLQSAWLNVPIEIESQQVIGASLGDVAIDQGLKAVLFGLLLVMIFMLAWYKGAGINAVVAQVLNLFMIFSILSAFGLTITLSSIAGMILTIGMAVDANVVVFERIRDEIRLGKTRSAAITSGFKHAFWAIMDANITTFIAAIFLSQLGTGSIQGFAVSLAIGVVSSVFTALFVSRLIFDFGTETLKKNKLSIGWGLSK